MTGVQTCALPIYHTPSRGAHSSAVLPDTSDKLDIPRPELALAPPLAESLRRRLGIKANDPVQQRKRHVPAGRAHEGALFELGVARGVASPWIDVKLESRVVASQLEDVGKGLAGERADGRHESWRSTCLRSVSCRASLDGGTAAYLPR